LLVLDISDPIPEVKRKYDSSIRVLNELGVPLGKVFYILNKADLVNEFESAIDKVNKLDMMDKQSIMAVSAKSGFNIGRLKELLADLSLTNRI
jgi:GTP-binding protein HflX